VLLGGNIGLFGTRTRTDILVLISVMGATHASEIARLLGISLSTAQNALDSLEQTGVIAGAIEGRSRRVRLNPRYFARDEIRSLLEKMAQQDKEIQERVSAIRRRPRRAGKKL
jgi:DNA-binding MarR family transcriptional regulator